MRTQTGAHGKASKLLLTARAGPNASAAISTPKTSAPRPSSPPSARPAPPRCGRFRTMPDSVRRIVAFLVALGVFSLDRWTKWLVETQFGSYDSKTVIPGFFNIVRSQNPGVAFGIFAENSSRSRTPLLVGVSIVAVLLLAGMLWRIDRLDRASCRE